MKAEPCMLQSAINFNKEPIMSCKRTAQLLRLVPKTESEKKLCNETIESLTWLLREVVAGRVTGVAWAATKANDNNVILDTAGEANHNPVRALGAVHCLSLDIARRLKPVQE